MKAWFLTLSTPQIPVVAGLAVLAALWLPGCSSDENFITEIPMQPPAGICMDEYAFQVGDQFDVKFFNEEDLDVSLIVRPDGRISLPLAEDLLVAGMTPAELDELLTEIYRKKIKNPEITIILNNFSGQKVWIAGSVLAPGPITLTGRMTVLQSIFNAGGPLATAKLDHVLLLRQDHELQETVTYLIDIDRRLSGETTIDFVLMPYDVIYVPKTTITKINEFVQQYISSMMPNFLRFGFSFSYPLKDRTVRHENSN